MNISSQQPRFGVRAVTPTGAGRVAKLLEAKPSTALDSEQNLKPITDYANRGRSTAQKALYDEESMKGYLGKLHTARQSDSTIRSLSPASQLDGTGVYPARFMKKALDTTGHQEFEKAYPLDEEMQLLIQQKAAKLAREHQTPVSGIAIPETLIKAYERTKNKSQALSEFINPSDPSADKREFRYYFVIDSTKNGKNADLIESVVRSKLDFQQKAQLWLDSYVDYIRPSVTNNPHARSIPLNSSATRVESARRRFDEIA